MPSRNVVKPDLPDAYYHIYARGAGKVEIFLEDVDYQFFLSLFARHLSLRQQSSRLSAYPHLRGDIELLCYCLMPNHIHLLVYQSEQGAMPRLMRSIMTSYSRYFNHKYKRSGALFETRYKASLIENEAYLLHISRYIHLNPRYYKRYPYSSLGYLTGQPSPEWLQPEKIQDLFGSAEKYKEFVADYEENKAMLDVLKKELAE